MSLPGVGWGVAGLVAVGVLLGLETSVRGQGPAAAVALEDLDLPALPDAAELPAEPPGMRLETAEIETAKLIVAELQEQVSVASAKLDPSAMERKRRMGTLRSLMRAVDEQITRLSARSQRLAVRQRQLRQDLSGGNREGDGVLSENARRLLERAQAPMQDTQARLDRLTRDRGQLQGELDALRQAHLSALLTVAAETDDHELLDVAGLEELTQQELQRGTTPE